MPRREKITVAILAAVFIVSLGQFIAGKIRFPVRSEKGVFAEGMVGRIRNINPVLVDFNDTDRDISELVFSGLIRYDPTEKNFFADLAEKWERSSDGRTYTFFLRKNARWHDGNPVTADDIIFTFRDVIQDPGFRNPILRNAFAGVLVNQASPETAGAREASAKPMNAPERRSVSFTLPKANSYFISHLTVGILPRHLLKDTPIANLEKSAFGQHPIGSGPYRVTRLRLDSDGDIADLSAFPEYYGEKPLLARIRFFTFPDEKTLVSERNALHAASKFNIASEKIGSLAQDDRFTFYPYTLNQFTALYFRTDNPFLKEKRVRQALTLGFDKEALLTSGELRIDSLGLTNRSKEPQFQTNASLAAHTLDDLGFRVGGEGFRVNSRGEKFSLKLLTLNKTPEQLAEKIRNQWQNLGVQIQIERASPEDFSAAMSERRYDLLLIRQNLGYNRDVYSLFHSSQIATRENKNGLNFSNFKSFGTDGLTEAIRKEKNPQIKEKRFAELSKIITDEAPVIFISTPIYAYALDKRMQPFPSASLDFHSDRLSILPSLSFPNL